METECHQETSRQAFLTTATTTRLSSLVALRQRVITLGGIYNYGDTGDHTVSGSITTDGTEAYGIVNSGSSGNTNTNTTASLAQ